MSVWRVLIGCLLLAGLVGPAAVTAVGATGPDGTTAQPAATGAQAIATESGSVGTEPQPLAAESQPLAAEPRPLATEPLTLTTTLRRTPDRVGEISATVTVDIPERELSVDVAESELDARRESWDPDEPAYTSGVLAKYGADFGSAANGAVTNPGAKR